MPESHWSSLFPLLRWLGYGGLLPFAALAAGSLLITEPGVRSQCLLLLKVYGLSIISFVGALSWGFALVHPDCDLALRRRLLLWSVLPSLVGCASFFLPSSSGCLVLAVTAALALAVDLRTATSLGLPQAWRSLRVHLSLGAIAALGVGALSA